MNKVTTSNTPHGKEPATNFAVIPYIHGVTEPIKIILNSHNVYIYDFHIFLTVYSSFHGFI